LRDNSISEDGILALTDAVQTNTVLVDLNVKLNQPGLRGEIALFKLLKVHQHLSPPTAHTTHSWTTPFSTSQSRPDFELIWKDEGVESTWDASQCRDIIQHFGADSVRPLPLFISLFYYSNYSYSIILKNHARRQVLRQLVEGEGLSPLVGRELLLEHLYIDNTKTAHRFFDSIFPEVRRTMSTAPSLLELTFILLVSTFLSSSSSSCHTTVARGTTRGNRSFDATFEEAESLKC
jgi:hypothetical protein